MYAIEEGNREVGIISSVSNLFLYLYRLICYFAFIQYHFSTLEKLLYESH